MIILIIFEGIDFSRICQNLEVLTTHEQMSHNKAKVNVLAYYVLRRSILRD
jgi:hypothetical protein